MLQKKKAFLERDYVKDLIVELEAEKDADRKTEIIYKLFESDGYPKTGNSNNNLESSNRPSVRGNGRILQKTSPGYKPGPAFANVLRNLFKIQYDRRLNPNIRSALSDTEVLNNPEEARRKRITLPTSIYQTRNAEKGGQKLDRKSLKPDRPRLQPRLGHSLPTALAGRQKLRNAEGRSSR